MIRIEADQLIDGMGDHPRRPGRVMIDGECIAALEAPVGASAPVADGPPPLSIALPGCTLLPGLIDFHSHLGIDTRYGELGAQVGVPLPEYAAHGIGRMLEDLHAGVTTVRLCGDFHGADLMLRRAVAEEEVIGPRLVGAGPAIRSPRCSGGAVASVLTDDPDEIDGAVRDNLDAGADFVKLFVSDGVGIPRSNRRPATTERPMSQGGPSGA